MGLDQYAHAEKNGETKEIACWRKHNRLQGYMEALHLLRTGKEKLNCNSEPLELTLEDVDHLNMIINGRNLPETEGFFFGPDSYGEYDCPLRGHKKDDLKFCKEARNRILNGYKVTYSCWW